MVKKRRKNSKKEGEKKNLFQTRIAKTLKPTVMSLVQKWTWRMQKQKNTS